MMNTRRYVGATLYLLLASTMLQAMEQTRGAPNALDKIDARTLMQGMSTNGLLTDGPFKQEQVAAAVQLLSSCFAPFSESTAYDPFNRKSFILETYAYGGKNYTKQNGILDALTNHFGATRDSKIIPRGMIGGLAAQGMSFAVTPATYYGHTINLGNDWNTKGIVAIAAIIACIPQMYSVKMVDRKGRNDDAANCFMDRSKKEGQFDLTFCNGKQTRVFTFDPKDEGKKFADFKESSATLAQLRAAKDRGPDAVDSAVAQAAYDAIVNPPQEASKEDDKKETE